MIMMMLAVVVLVMHFVVVKNVSYSLLVRTFVRLVGS